MQDHPRREATVGARRDYGGETDKYPEDMTHKCIFLHNKLHIDPLRLFSSSGTSETTNYRSFNPEMVGTLPTQDDRKKVVAR